MRFSHIRKKSGLPERLHEDRCEEVVEDLVLARAWRGQAVGMALAERLKLRTQLAAAVGNLESVSLSRLHGRKRFGS